MNSSTSYLKCLILIAGLLVNVNSFGTPITPPIEVKAEEAHPLETKNQKTNKEYRLGVQNFDYFPHYDFTDDVTDSFLEAIIELFRQSTGIILKPIPLPTKRLEYNFFVQQELDLIYPANPRWYQSKYTDTHYSDTFVTTLAGTMVAETGAAIETINSISIPFGFTPVKWIEEEKSRKVNIFGVPSALKALEMVSNNRTDAADVEFNVAMHINRQQGFSLVLDPSLPLSFPEFQFASIQHPHLISALNRFLKENSEEIANIKRNLHIKETVSAE